MGKSFYGKWFRFVRSVFRIFWPTHKPIWALYHAV